MPHKRARQPMKAEEKPRRRTVADLALTIRMECEPVPKSVSRVLDARQIRREYRKKKRQLDGAGNSGEDNTVQRKKSRLGIDDGKITALRIRPGETVAQFNGRVENCMAPLVRTAMRQSSARARRMRREEAAEQTIERGAPPEGSDGDKADDDGRQKGAKEFDVVSTSTPRRLNDVAREPPTIKKLPRGAAKHDAGPSGVLGMASKAMMEEERDKVIRHYRELKARKLRESSDGRLDGTRTEELP